MNPPNPLDATLLERELILAESAHHTETMKLTVKPARSWLVVDNRFDVGDPICFISWEMRLPGRGTQCSELRPLTMSELKEFGKLCIKVAEAIGVPTSED